MAITHNLDNSTKNHLGKKTELLVEENNTLTITRVEEILYDCFLTKDELSVDNIPLIDYTRVDGVTTSFGLHPERLESHRDDVQQLLSQLPFGVFEHSKGQGMSFLQLCVTANGKQWAEHKNIEQLLVLALGLNECSYILPREVWSALPGGVPYIQVKQNKYC